MSSIQDMNNRIAQNRKLRPSQREKFKNNRETIHSVSKAEKSDYKEFTADEVQEAIDAIQLKSKKAKRIESVLYTLLLLVGLLLFIRMIML